MRSKTIDTDPWFALKQMRYIQQNESFYLNWSEKGKKRAWNDYLKVVSAYLPTAKACSEEFGIDIILKPNRQ